MAREEIAANDYNLNVVRYVDASEEEADVDLVAIRAERVKLKAELASLEAKLTTLLQGIDYV